MDSLEVRDQPLVRIDCKQGLLKAVRFNADGQYSLTCGSDRTIKLWRPIKLLQLKCYRAHSAEVMDAEARADNSQFVSCSMDKSVISWDVENGKLLRRFRNMAPFNTICYGGSASTDSSNTVFAGSADGTVRIYDLRSSSSFEPIQSLSEAGDAITCCRVSKHLVFTTSLDKCLRTYDIRQGKLAIDTLGVALNHVALSADGNLVLVSCLRRSLVALADRAKGTILQEYRGHENKLFRLECAFAMKDTLVVAGSEDGKVYVWSKSEGAKRPLLALRHTDVSPPIIQSISSDTLDHLLTACSGHMFMWSI